MEKRMMSVDDLAKVMDVSRPTAYQLAHSDGFPAVRVGRRIKIPCSSFEAWLEKQTQANKN